MVTAVTTPSVPASRPDPLLEQAKEIFARQLGVDVENVDVKVGRDDPDQPRGSHARRIRPLRGTPGEAETQELIFTVRNMEGVDLEELRIKDEARAKLAKLQPLADYAQMVPQEQLAVELQGKLQKAAEGTNFNTKLLDWPGFRPEVIKEGWEIGDYAGQNIQDSAYGVKITLHFPHAKGEDTSKTIERFKEILEGRLAQIKEILTDRVVLYTKKNMAERGLTDQEKQEAHKKLQNEGLTEEEKQAARETAEKKGITIEQAEAGIMEGKVLAAKIDMTVAKVREDMDKLIITPDIDHNNLVVTMRSPKQAEEYKKADPNTRDEENWRGAPEGGDELRNTSPLTSRIVGLTTGETPATETTPARSGQLPKAVMRALLFDKEKHLAPDALAILGRKDLQAAIIKEVHARVKNQHPEKMAAFKEIIESELFQNHGSWHNTPGDVGVAKPEPALNRIADGTLEVAFTLRQDKDPEKNQLLKVVQGLADLQKEPETSITTTGFLSASATAGSGIVSPADTTSTIVNGGQQYGTGQWTNAAATQDPSSISVTR